MNLQYPKNYYKVLDNKEFEIPEWHKEIIDQRLDAYKQNPNNVIDFEQALIEIEKEL